MAEFTEVKEKAPTGKILVYFFGKNEYAFVQHEDAFEYTLHKQRFRTKARGLEKAIALADTYWFHSK